MIRSNMKESVAKKLITIVSVAVPVVVAILFGVRLPNVEPLSFLPPIYASINGLTALLLVVALWAINEDLYCLVTFISFNVCGIPYDFGFYSIWWRGNDQNALFHPSYFSYTPFNYYYTACITHLP